MLLHSPALSRSYSIAQVFFWVHLYPPLRRLDDCLEHWKLCKIDYNDCILETEEENGDRGWKLLPGSRNGECRTQWADVRRKNNGINIGSFCPFEGRGTGTCKMCARSPVLHWFSLAGHCAMHCWFLDSVAGSKRFLHTQPPLGDIAQWLPLCAANVLPVIYMIFPFPKAAGCRRVFPCLVPITFG